MESVERESCHWSLLELTTARGFYARRIAAAAHGLRGSVPRYRARLWRVGARTGPWFLSLAAPAGVSGSGFSAGWYICVTQLFSVCRIPGPPARRIYHGLILWTGLDHLA
jgi:hypothetical protein